MSHIYVSWPFGIDVVFRTKYMDVVGEEVQQVPLVNSTGTRAFVGSSRITAEQRTTLDNDPLLVGVIFYDDPPSNYSKE